MAAACEVSVLARRLNLDPQVYFNVVTQSSGDSWVFRNWFPLPGVVDTSPSSHQYEPGFMIDLIHKDLYLANATAAEFGLRLETAAAAQKMFASTSAKGLGQRDCTGLVLGLDGCPRATFFTASTWSLSPTGRPRMQSRSSMCARLHHGRGASVAPMGSPGAQSTLPIWSMWMNGSKAVCGTPANPRRTGNPSPSNADGAVVTDRTGRCVPVAGLGTGTRGKVRVSAVMAGMNVPLR